MNKVKQDQEGFDWQIAVLESHIQNHYGRYLKCCSCDNLIVDSITLDYQRFTERAKRLGWHVCEDGPLCPTCSRATRSQ